MMSAFGQFRTSALDLISLRRRRLDAVELPNAALQAELRDLYSAYLDLVGTTTPADQEAIGAFYGEVLEVFGSNEEIFQQCPDVAGLPRALRIKGSREHVRGLLQRAKGKG